MSCAVQSVPYTFGLQNTGKVTLHGVDIAEGAFTARSDNANTGTRPPADTRLASSKRADSDDRDHTAFAAESLGDVVYVEPPTLGSRLAAGQTCGEIESTKSVSDIYAPADGEVVEVNTALSEDPSIVNTEPFGAGWLFKLQVSDLPDLLDARTYQALTETGTDLNPGSAAGRLRS